ncbi:unnamed protein product [Hymenolepis diminuta]|uniref:Uncharacterized protein n=1 Tax=Hymenolepis diminuta TaxID=6216 RepID=A0A564Y0X5_HYMDI|nr:unnamed protein product [Hymenolepis diminuta]
MEFKKNAFTKSRLRQGSLWFDHTVMAETGSNFMLLFPFYQCISFFSFVYSIVKPYYAMQ